MIALKTSVLCEERISNTDIFFFFFDDVCNLGAMHHKRVTFSSDNGTVSPKDYKRFVTIKTDACLASCWPVDSES